MTDDELAMAQEDATLQRNFQGYTSHGHCDLIGLGVSAISQVGDLYTQNSNDLHDYQHQLASDQLATKRGVRCNVDDQLRRAIIGQLICHFSLDIAVIERTFAIVFQDYFADVWPQLLAMAEDGLLDINATCLHIKPAGRLVARSICMVFDAYLNDSNRQRFSRVI